MGWAEAASVSKCRATEERLAEERAGTERGGAAFSAPLTQDLLVLKEGCEAALAAPEEARDYIGLHRKYKYQEAFWYITRVFTNYVLLPINYVWENRIDKAREGEGGGWQTLMNIKRGLEKKIHLSKRRLKNVLLI